MPGDPPAEADLHDSKARTHECISPNCWREKCSTAEQHQAQTHHRHNTYGEGPTGNNGGALQPEANTPKGGKEARLVESGCYKAANDDRTPETSNETSGQGGAK